MQVEVSTDVPYGNAADIEVVEAEGSTEVRFAAHPHGGPECLWFCFAVTARGAAERDAVLRLVLEHPDNMLGGSDLTAMRPVVRYEGGDWERLGAGAVEQLPDGRRTVAWTTPAPEGRLEVAYCYPYGLPEVDALVDESDGYWHSDTIGVSQGGRPLLRLSNAYGETDSGRPGLYLVARQHSAETPGSWVLDGFLRALAEIEGKAPLAWCVPLSNIDGVVGGDYGKDNFPYDLNRAWGSVPMRHETLVIKRDVGRWAKRCRPVLGIDFHAPGACESDGAYCYLPKPDLWPELHDQTKALTEAVGVALTPVFACPNFSRVADYPSRWETPSFGRFMTGERELPAFTIETPYALAGQHVPDREDYREIGRRVAAAVVGALADGWPGATG